MDTTPEVQTYIVVSIAIFLAFAAIIIYLLVNLLSNRVLLNRARAELEEHSSNLERRVNDQTEQLNDSEMRFRQLVENINEVFWIVSPDWNKVIYISPAYEEVWGRTCESLYQQPRSWLEAAAEEDFERVTDEVNKKKGGDFSQAKFPEYRIVKPDGSVRWISAHFFPVRSELGTVDNIVGITEDITERKLAEEALRQSEAQYRSLIEQSNDAIYLIYEDKFVLINKKFTETLGVTPEEARAPGFNFMELVAPQSRPLVEERSRMVERGEQPPKRYEFVALTKDGKEIEVEASVTNVSYRGETAVQGILRDVSERKRLEAQFRQAQKMEAVGRLAGGVAHDFNNLLTVITGNAELARMTLNPDDPLNYDIQEIRKASDRAADLTRQLLAFSRKQTLQPKILNLNRIIENMDKMLRRLIGENIDLLTVPDPDLWKVKVDPGQIEQVIVNLAVNARDAMPEGGNLTVETKNVELDKEFTRNHPSAVPGRHVMLAISDTGCGMNEEVKDRVFEPFFTTKEEGKGTGLGLATVYGIIKQSGGHIWVYSEPGEGTTFKIYFPIVEEGEAEDIIGRTASDFMPKGSESVLVVEDEDNVRMMAVRILKLQGYKVIEARTGGDAYLICQRMAKPVDLVITDVIMPHMGGPELVKLLNELWPELKVLYMSGYTPNAVVHDGILDSSTPYLQKPFRPIELAQKVRGVLDG